MPSLLLCTPPLDHPEFGDEANGIRSALLAVAESHKTTLLNQVVIRHNMGVIFRGENASPFWLEIVPSVEIAQKEVVAIANLFIDLLDIKVAHPQGSNRLFKKRGTGPIDPIDFDEECGPCDCSNSGIC